MSKSPFEGVKVVDFTWLAAGPLMAAYLADFGAVVVKIESVNRPDPWRFFPPFKDNEAGMNRSVGFGYYNRNKYSATLNLSDPSGLEVAKRLVAWADVVLESFTPGTMEKWELTYNDLVKVKPDIIMLSTNMQGQTGPRATIPGLGIQMAALCGFSYLTGWPDREPLQPIAYTDSVAALFGAAAIIAALDYHRRTGKGQYLDLSQFETSLQFLAPVFLDYNANGREAVRAGNRCSYAAPHGVYRCKGDDRWCAVSVFSDDEWLNLCQAMGNPKWSQDTEFSTLRGRKQHEVELDGLIEKWTTKCSAEDVMTRLQSAGVAAGVVENGEDLFNDPQMKYRGHFWTINHPEIGAYRCDAPPFRMSLTPAEARRHAPCMGEHNDYVYTKLVGMSDKEFTELVEKGVIQ
jgi:benzylsuccinate CoA-transferase BbsF subunit